MWDEEKEHRETFERLIVEHRVRPTALLPLWNIAGFVLGDYKSGIIMLNLILLLRGTISDAISMCVCPCNSLLIYMVSLEWQN